VKSRFRKITEFSIFSFLSLNGITSIVILAGIFAILLMNSVNFFEEKSFFSIINTYWNPQGYYEDSYGIISLIISSITVTFIAMIIAIPLGILSSVYLVYIAPFWLSEILKPIIEVIAAIPSVVIGFLGIVLISPLLASVTGASNGLNALNGGILLAIMALPTIVSISEDSLKAVPRSYIEASYALGATRWQTLWRVAIPSALSGIIAAIMLGLGRAIGETMTVLMVTGNSLAMPESILSQVRTLTATIAIEMGEVDFHSTHYFGLFMVGLVLFVFTFIINTVSDMLGSKYQQVDR